MAKEFFEIPSYHDFITPPLANYLLQEAQPVEGLAGLCHVGQGGGLENKESFKFLLDLYLKVKSDLQLLLKRRTSDRKFIDQRTAACYELNTRLNCPYLDPGYQTVLGMEDADDRIVFGPKSASFCEKSTRKIAPIPKFLQGSHVTLFGPPDHAKLAINAMNAYHRRLKEEPPIIGELLAKQNHLPKWGADNEDSKTPLRSDLVDAATNLSECFTGQLQYTDPLSKKNYTIASTHRALPIKRFPGLALPCNFLFYHKNPLPLHLYDFALHVFRNWHVPEALVFYVPKIENEEEAQYLHTMIQTAEHLLKQLHPSYTLGSMRLLLVLENPRAILRLHEIIDALEPYFVGASLGWHDYLAATARLFKEDANYRIPRKTDPSIVIRYIKASHQLLADVVGSRGGIKIGGMYGILPVHDDLYSPSFQVALKGLFKDLITQLKRDLSGFWLAHPDFVRIALALMEAWTQYQEGSKAALQKLIKDLLKPPYDQEILNFLEQADIQGLAKTDANFVRSLLVADLLESPDHPNCHEDEVRYNIFQCLQYLTDWLSGRGCVALPSQLEGHLVRVMDDLATAERSRWEVWHEVRHGRLPLAKLVQIAHEELHFIRKNEMHAAKIVQVKWDARTAGWYPIAFRIMLQLMSQAHPVEFASELLLPFTVESVRSHPDPWSKMMSLDRNKFRLDPKVERLNYFFEKCGCLSFAEQIANESILDLAKLEAMIMNFSLEEIKEAARFHGDIGEDSSKLDAHAMQEQALLKNSEQLILQELRELGSSYQAKFGFKFLISAKDKKADYLLAQLKLRLLNSKDQEIFLAKEALWQISKKRILAQPLDEHLQAIKALMNKHQITGAAIALASDRGVQEISLGFAEKDKRPVHNHTFFELASLSKTLASAFAIEYFNKKGIPLDTSVNRLLAKTSSNFRLRLAKEKEWLDEVNIEQILNHTALNMHYVKGFSRDKAMPPLTELLLYPERYGYSAIEVLHKPGTIFQYSGGGYLVLEHLIEAIEGKSIQELIRPFLRALGNLDLSFEAESFMGKDYANGYFDNGEGLAAGYLIFPAFAAGAFGTAGAMLSFLGLLGQAYHSLEGAGPISHDTAVRMLQGIDKGAREFMGCRIGLGVFIAEAGANRLAIHQGANDGFRAIYVYCFAGPDRCKGFVVLCNSNDRGVAFIAEIGQILLAALDVTGIDYQRFKSDFDFSQLKPEEIVNLGYKELLFSAFQADLPEEILERGPRDPLADYNKLVQATLLSLSNQGFARAENLLSPYEPQFDPKLFGRQGKIMDSWESVRHNAVGRDSLELKMSSPASIRWLSLSTAYHDGNQVNWVRLYGRLQAADEWQQFLFIDKVPGHSFIELALQEKTQMFQYIRVEIGPDGGLTRLALYEILPEAVRARFKLLLVAQWRRYPIEIPKSQKPLTIKYTVSAEQVQKNLKRCSPKSIDYASLAFGGQLIRASNEHYGPAVQLISPYIPLHMFDGLESARSRVVGASEEFEIKLGRSLSAMRVVMDFKYFIHNNPVAVAIFAWNEGRWVEVLPKALVKAFAGNQKEFKILTEKPTDRIRVRTYPDGGMNRLHVFALESVE